MTAEKHDGAVRGFYHYGESWYRQPDRKEIDHVMIGFYHPAGGTTGEFRVAWISLGHKAAPRLEVFDDAWDALSGFKDVLDKMREVDGENISPKDFCKLLKSCGLKDLTERERGTR